MLSVNRGILSGDSHRAWSEQSDSARPLDQGISQRRRGCPPPQAERKSTHHAEITKRAAARFPTRRDCAAAEGSARRKSETAHRDRLFKRAQEAASAGKDAEQKARIVHSLRGEFHLKDILAVTGVPKSTYMYWQKKFAQPEVPDEREQLILAIRKEHKDYGYRHLWPCSVSSQTSRCIEKAQDSLSYAFRSNLLGGHYIAPAVMVDAFFIPIFEMEAFMTLFSKFFHRGTSPEIICKSTTYA